MSEFYAGRHISGYASSLSHGNRKLSLEFVTFHVSLRTSEAVHPNQTLAHDEYLSMIEMMFASARLFHPGAATTVLTDARTELKLRRGVVDRVVRAGIDTSKLMLERANAQLRHVLDSDFRQPKVILDSDILVNASLEPVFDTDFDVAVTWREREDQPINGGFLILNNARPAVTKRFFERFTTIYRDRYSDQAAWFGDQLALRDCVGLGPSAMAKHDLVEVDGCRVLLLPCDLYNFSPDNQYSEICTALPEKSVLHFKGERKRLMRPFWRAWLRPRSSYSPKAAFDGWRERRWLHEQAAFEMPAPPAVQEGNP